MIKAIIFDFDGVLTDNTDIIVRIYQETAGQCGLKIPSRKEVVAILGMTGKDMMKRLYGRKKQYKIAHYQNWNKYKNQMKLRPELETVLKK